MGRVILVLVRMLSRGSTTLRHPQMGLMDAMSHSAFPPTKQRTSIRLAAQTRKVAKSCPAALVALENTEQTVVARRLRVLLLPLPPERACRAKAYLRMQPGQPLGPGKILLHVILSVMRGVYGWAVTPVRFVSIPTQMVSMRWRARLADHVLSLPSSSHVVAQTQVPARRARTSCGRATTTQK